MLIDNSETEQEYEVEKILKKKVALDENNNDHIYYLVHWKGWS